MMVGALTRPFGTGYGGVTAENVAAEAGISRADRDAFAPRELRSARPPRSNPAISPRRQIVPIEIVTVKRQTSQPAFSDQHEHPKPTTLDAPAKLKTVFRKGSDRDRRGRSKRHRTTARRRPGCSPAADAGCLGGARRAPAFSVPRLVGVRPGSDEASPDPSPSGGPLERTGLQARRALT